VREYRQIPSSRLVQRLGLAKYDGEARFEDPPVEPARVVLRMDQHAGERARPVVQEGQGVLEGDVIGEADASAVAARVHASITGTVTAVSEDEVVIAAGSGDPGSARSGG